MSAKNPRRDIDWKKVRDRLAKSSSALEQTRPLASEQVHAILEARARALAQVPKSAPATGSLLEVLIFSLGQERYAVETRYLREVLRVKEIIPLPGVPDFLLGITNLRGQILSVFQVHSFFDLATPPLTELARIVVLGQDRVEFGFMADAVHEVAMLHIDRLSEPPASVSGSARGYLRGVTADSLLLLEGSVLLSSPRFVIDLSDEGPNH